MSVLAYLEGLLAGWTVQIENRSGIITVTISAERYGTFTATSTRLETALAKAYAGEVTRAA